jgi:hypothetical protein
MIYDGQVIANSVVYAALGNWFIGHVKKSKLVPLINEQTYWINKTFAMLVAGIAALGVTYTYSYSAEGVLTVVINGLTLGGLWISFKTWLFSYVLQQTGYHLTKENK